MLDHCGHIGIYHMADGCSLFEGTKKFIVIVRKRAHVSYYVSECSDGASRGTACFLKDGLILFSIFLIAY